MKKTIFAALLSLAALAVACQPDNGGNNQADDNTITLASDVTTIAMNADNQSQAAVKFTWNAASNKGTGARITYSILFDKAGNSFANSYELSLGTNITEKSFTGLEINNIMTDQLGCKSGDKVDIEVCIYAMINDDSVDDVISNTVALNVAVFTPAIEVLYMIGSATAAGWDLASAVAMTPISGEKGGFTWSGELSMGELKFLVNTADWFPCYVKDEAAENKIIYRDAEHEETIPDNKFVFESEGNYKIDLNINTLDIAITQLEGPEYYNMCLTGDLFAKPVAMKRSGYVFFWGGELSAAGNNTFSFVQNADLTGGRYYAATENAAYTEQSISKSSLYSWQLTSAQCGKVYKINLYTKKDKEIMNCVQYTPFETIYLIGSATSAGWEIANAVPMNKADAYTQMWTGPLAAGELKFTCDRSDDWYGAWYLASKSNATPTGDSEPMYFVNKASAETGKMGIKEFDQKWLISEENAGNYQITLDQKNETVIIKKL